jgi:hypothetical protein
MDAERREDEIRDATQEMARGGDEMEEQLDRLGDDIAEAKQTAAQRPDAPQQRTPAGETAEDDGDDEDPAGDWRVESESGGDAEADEEG